MYNLEGTLKKLIPGKCQKDIRNIREFISVEMWEPWIDLVACTRTLINYLCFSSRRNT